MSEVGNMYGYHHEIKGDYQEALVINEYPGGYIVQFTNDGFHSIETWDAKMLSHWKQVCEEGAA